MQQEIENLKKQVQKSMKLNDSKRIKDLLKEFDKIEINLELLQQTKIGVYLTDLRKSTFDDDIKRLCKDLVQKWKQSLKSPPKFENIETSQQSKSSTNSARERSIVTDNVTITTTGNKVRNKCTEMLYQAFATNTDIPSHQVLKTSIRVEKIVHDINGVNESYKSKIRMLVSNLKTNQDLKLDVLNDIMTVKDFANATAEQLMSKDRQKVVAETEKQILIDAVTPTQHVAETDMFRCSKCKQRRCTYYQLQTRFLF